MILGSWSEGLQQNLVFLKRVFLVSWKVIQEFLKKLFDVVRPLFPPFRLQWIRCEMFLVDWCGRSKGFHDLVSMKEKFCMLCSFEKTSCERQLMWFDQWDQEWKDLSERQLVWLDQWDQERNNCCKINEILFDQWGQKWETIVVRSVRSCKISEI